MGFSLPAEDKQQECRLQGTQKAWRRRPWEKESLGAPEVAGTGQEGRTAGYSGSWSEKGGTPGLRSTGNSPPPGPVAPTCWSPNSEQLPGRDGEEGAGRGLCPPLLLPQERPRRAAFLSILSRVTHQSPGLAVPGCLPSPTGHTPKASTSTQGQSPSPPTPTTPGPRAQRQWAVYGRKPRSEGQCSFQNHAAHFSRAILCDHLS